MPCVSGRKGLIDIGISISNADHLQSSTTDAAPDYTWMTELSADTHNTQTIKRIAPIVADYFCGQADFQDPFGSWDFVMALPVK